MKEIKSRSKSTVTYPEIENEAKVILSITRKMMESVRTLTPIINPNNRVGINPHGKSKKDE